MTAPSLTDLGLDPQAMLKALYKARASGALEVEYQDAGVQRRVRYRSDSDLAAAIAALEGKLAADAGGSSVNIVNIRSSKGWT
ncbi:phage head-tail joining protein [Methyloceanibacter caenitepidi]|uniref:Uncharacterized protein n=1 Tax=Methyloceanibacter caenitepidi TaxID=1384459 RepID=A0A0A8K3K5_9HYPH|nr:hypothetical protein [Methyloceanibacter caenitepidi]BAQ17480.1 hypothetical protein GL4_2033 [Methyloceanibacter caenitepidi]